MSVWGCYRGVVCELCLCGPYILGEESPRPPQGAHFYLYFVILGGGPPKTPLYWGYATPKPPLVGNYLM